MSANTPPLAQDAPIFVSSYSIVALHFTDVRVVSFLEAIIYKPYKLL